METQPKEDQKFRDLSPWLKWPTLLILTFAFSMVALRIVQNATQTCETERHIWIEGSNDPDAPPWLR
jgi:hypothetical protein